MLALRPRFQSVQGRGASGSRVGSSARRSTPWPSPGLDSPSRAFTTLQTHHFRHRVATFQTWRPVAGVKAWGPRVALRPFATVAKDSKGPNKAKKTAEVKKTTKESPAGGPAKAPKSAAPRTLATASKGPQADSPKKTSTKTKSKEPVEAESDKGKGPKASEGGQSPRAHALGRPKASVAAKEAKESKRAVEMKPRAKASEYGRVKAPSATLASPEVLSAPKASLAAKKQSPAPTKAKQQEEAEKKVRTKHTSRQFREEDEEEIDSVELPTVVGGGEVAVDAVTALPPAPLGTASFLKKVLHLSYDTCIRENCRDVVVVDLSDKTHWVHYLIIATGLAARHNVAVAEKIRKELKSHGLVRNAQVERNEGDEWVIVSGGGAVSVQLVTQAQRAELDLERLWVLKRSKEDSLLFAQEEECFLYDEEDGMDDDDEDVPSSGWNPEESVQQAFPPKAKARAVPAKRAPEKVRVGRKGK